MPDKSKTTGDRLYTIFADCAGEFSQRLEIYAEKYAKSK
jgi:hypothetical protein